MLVEIDLLPKKQARNVTVPIVIAISIVLALIVTISLFVFQSTLNKEISEVESELTVVSQLREAKEVNMRSPQQTTSAQKLETTVQWAESYPTEMVPILNHLVGLLPDRGLVQNFSYNEDSSVNVAVQFDSSRDAAYYLNHLNESDYFKEVNLSSISTTNLQNEENNDVLPRYVGQYSIILNKEYAKEQQGQEDEE
ncbi:PilN domain-containing protein [Sutcliffiella sp. NC1]|uniref:PilN domain-containing protein n=1 Tax=Sutcliffiella sp. NC1 TaxID=3004096 RepID=UPI0022DD528A|nr:PilN domain-containing protein [Sutcliffiella sp. NC1]WBL13992.1 hypothetical protein O1A01_19070 [Sutcliffiella sp. NC1]